MYCSKCGRFVEDSMQFCPECGSATGEVPGGVPAEEYSGGAGLTNSQMYGVAAYITWIGLVIALFMSDRSDRFVRFHLNQSLVLNLALIVGGIVALVPIIGTIIGLIMNIVTMVLWLIGFIGAIQGKMKPVPLLGQISILR